MLNIQTETTRDDNKAQIVSGLFASGGLLHKLLDAGLSLIFPPRCAGCGCVDTDWCERCQRKIEQTPVTAISKALSGLDAVAATGLHRGKLRDIVQALKYENARHLSPLLGERLYICLSETGWAIDIIIPVPLHTARLQARGYNQSELLGEYIAERLHLVCQPAAIERLRNTSSQVGLSGNERKLNMLSAFHAVPKLVENQTILLVDDVCTTGATLRACAEAARSAGANRVYGLTVTIAS